MSGSRRASRSHRRFAQRLTIALPLLALLAASIYVCVQLRQNSLDAALIQAIKHRQASVAVSPQASVAISLLDKGASANAVESPDKPLTLSKLLSDFWVRLRRNGLKQKKGVSALMLACTIRGSFNHSDAWLCAPADLSLVRALL